MEMNTLPTTRAGRIEQLRRQIENLDNILASGVMSSTIDGVTVTYRSRNEIFRERTLLHQRLQSLIQSADCPRPTIFGVPNNV